MRVASRLLLRRAGWALVGYPAHHITSLLDESQWWPRQQLEAFRDAKLRRLIAHCYEHVPYYRRLMDAGGLQSSDIQSAADLRKLPVLTKDSIRAHWHELRAENIPDKATFIAETGGTTGEPMRIAKVLYSEAWANMCYERGLSWGGVAPGMKHIELWGGAMGCAKQTWRQQCASLLAGRRRLLAYDLGQDNVHTYIDVIRRSQSPFIVGYASSMYLLARMLLERREQLHVQAVFTTAECLLPSWAATIRQAMHCKVYAYYGCGECNSMGYQCQQGDAYHIPEEHVVLEVEPEVGHTDLLETGQVLITDLDNYAMPLVRYQNGDYMTLGDTDCVCGRSLRLIAKLEGRTHEFLLNASRGLISGGICDSILGNIGSIREFQVRQDGLEHIRVLVVPCRKLTEEENGYIRKSFRHYLGETMDVEIQIVDSIPRTKAQKLQTAVNELL